MLAGRPLCSLAVIGLCGPLHTLPVYPLGLTRRGALQAAISSGDMSTEGLEEEAWLVVQHHQEKLYAAGGKQQQPRKPTEPNTDTAHILCLTSSRTNKSINYGLANGCNR